MDDERIMIFYLDPNGMRRGWAKGLSNDIDKVREAAQDRLNKWIEHSGEDWELEDFREFVAEVREDS